MNDTLKRVVEAYLTLCKREKEAAELYQYMQEIKRAATKKLIQDVADHHVEWPLIVDTVVINCNEDGILTVSEGTRLA